MFKCWHFITMSRIDFMLSSGEHEKKKSFYNLGAYLIPFVLSFFLSVFAVLSFCPCCSFFLSFFLFSRASCQLLGNYGQFIMANCLRQLISLAVFRSFFRTCVRPSVRPSDRLSARPFVRSFVRYLARSFVRSFVWFCAAIRA